MSSVIEQLTVGDLKRFMYQLPDELTVCSWIRFPDINSLQPGYTKHGTATSAEVQGSELVVLGEYTRYDEWASVHPDVPCLTVGTLKRFVEDLPNAMGVHQGVLRGEPRVLVGTLISLRRQTESILDVSKGNVFALYANASWYE